MGGHIRYYWRPGVALLATVGLQVGGYVNPTLGAFLLGMAALWFLFAAAHSPTAAHYLPQLARWLAYQQAPISDQEKGVKYFSRRTIHIAELADQGDTIESVTFDNCLIVGPAVLFPDGIGTFHGNTIDGAPDSFLIELLPEQTGMLGVIRVNNCHFLKCNLSRIGMIGPKPMVDKWRADLRRIN